MNPIRKTINLALSPLLSRRADQVSGVIAKHLNEGQSVLDVGCGDMLVAQNVLAKKNVNISGIDIIDYNKTALPHKLYDGLTFPYKDNSFDVVLFSFILHHSEIETQLKLIDEARRVAKKHVIILEDTYDTEVKKFFTKVYDFSVNKLMCISIPCPFTYRTIPGWKKLFKEKKFKVEEVEHIDSLFINPQQQVLFKLKK